MEEEKRHYNVIKLQSKDQTKAISSAKKILLTQTQYETALEYATTRATGKIEEGIYAIGLADCTDFV